MEDEKSKRNPPRRIGEKKSLESAPQRCAETIQSGRSFRSGSAGQKSIDGSQECLLIPPR
jgi:hypothetical protein